MTTSKPIDVHDEIAILGADLNARQQEIAERTRSENYLIVIYFTVLGGIVAGLALLQSYLGVAAQAPPATQTIDFNFFPTLVLLGSLATAALPVDLIHLGYATELRRVYIQTNLEPRLRQLTGSANDGAFSYERFDRKQHLGWGNAVLIVRGAFFWLPTLILLAAYLVLRLTQTQPPSVLEFVVEMTAIGLEVGALALFLGTFYRMATLVLRTQK